MIRQPFTDDGVNSKRQELYRLPDDALRTETESLRVDLRSWIHYHFALNEKQSSFLQSMQYPFIQELAESVSDCIFFRLELIIKWPPLEPIGSKFVMPNSSNLIRTINPDGGYTVSGYLEIEIGYN